MPSLLIFSTAGLAALLALFACSPALNWREVRPENTRLSLLLPCKPDKAHKRVPLGGQTVVLSMLGCEAAGATFALATADLGDATRAGPVLALWLNLTLTHMNAAPATRRALPLKIPGAANGVPVIRVAAQGQQADGTAVAGQAAYFAHGTQVFQVVMYAPKIEPEVAETFFSSLKFE